MSLQAAAFNLLWFHLVQSGTLICIAPEHVRSHSARYLIGLAVSVAATLVALIYPIASIAAYVGIALLFLFAGRHRIGYSRV